MKRTLIGLTLIGLVLGVAGCAADPLVKPFWILNESMFRQLTAGKSTKADAFAVLGKPILQATFDRVGLEVWDYRYMDYATYMYAWVYFDREGVFKGYASQMDPAFYSAGNSR